MFQKLKDYEVKKLKDKLKYARRDNKGKEDRLKLYELWRECLKENRPDVQTNIDEESLPQDNRSTFEHSMIESAANAPNEYDS